MPEHREQGPSRRRFLQALGTAALAATTVGCGSSCGGAAERRGARPAAPPPGPAAAAEGRSRVVVVTTKRALTSGYDADRGALRAMLAAGLTRLCDAPDAAAALRRFFRPGETVGLKVNGLAGRQAATHVELVDELGALLRRSDVDGAHQLVFDRAAVDLVTSGFQLSERGDGYRCAGNDAVGYEEEPTVMPSSASRLSRIATERIDAMLSVPVLKQHMLSGTSGALKNLFGCIDNPNKMHVDRCDPYIAEVAALPQLRGKQRLVVVDALRPVIDNGPSYQPGMGAEAHTLIFGVDPVAVDTVGRGLLDRLRTARGLPTLAAAKLEPTYIATAARLGLGVGDEARIDLVTLEV
ncbi:MAG TPA: DUF362 domain-containing protein [Polyangia bacterium]